MAKMAPQFTFSKVLFSRNQHCILHSSKVNRHFTNKKWLHNKLLFGILNTSIESISRKTHAILHLRILLQAFYILNVAPHLHLISRMLIAQKVRISKDRLSLCWTLLDRATTSCMKTHSIDSPTPPARPFEDESGEGRRWERC